MENIDDIRLYHSQSLVMTTLHRQIQALSPLRISYQNLQQYHQKIIHDFSSLLDQHDYAISSLKSTIHNLSTIGSRTESQRNDLITELKDRQNDEAKLILDTRNMAQKYQSLNQKINLQSNRTQQNFIYQTELKNILQTLKSQILNIQNLNNQLQIQQAKITSQRQRVNVALQNENNKKNILQHSNQELKCKIAKINIKNDDIIDGNRKLSEQIRENQEQIMTRIKINRQFKQKLIELTSEFQKLNNQIDYKTTLINAENSANTELSFHQEKLSTMICQIEKENEIVNKQNYLLSNEIQGLQKMRDESSLFRLNSQNHLSELKHANQLLLSKMEQYCMQDRQIQSLLIRKLTSLQHFSKKLNQKYEFQPSYRTEIAPKQKSLFRQRSFNLDDLKLMKEKISKVESQSSDATKGTKLSSKQWTKQNIT